MTAPLWSCGILGKTHGLHGELYLSPSPNGVDYLDLGTSFFLGAPRGSADETLTPCHIQRVGGTDLRPLVLLDLADTREGALALQGREVFARGPALDELPHFVVGDLIGLRAETASGRALGTIDDILENPVHEILSIATPQGTTILVPLVEALVTIDFDAGVARVVDDLLDDLS
ncbi:MAG: hypothetical protein R2826_05610 [Thermoleophilia bacterium]